MQLCCQPSDGLGMSGVVRRPHVTRGDGAQVRDGPLPAICRAGQVLADRASSTGSEPARRRARSAVGGEMPERLDKFLDILGKVGLELQALARGRMLEDEAEGVQGLAREGANEVGGRAELARLGLEMGAIGLVADQRMADMGHVNADLMRATPLALEPHFMAISRYGDAEESLGRVQILLDVDVDLAGRDVILVEDIVDTGLTLRYLLGVLRAREPASLEVCALLDKSVRRIVPITPRYVGFECPDRFVVGYGLDFRERYRNLPDILQVDDLALVIGVWSFTGTRDGEAVRLSARNADVLRRQPDGTWRFVIDNPWGVD